MSEFLNPPARHQYEAFLQQLPSDWEQKKITQVGSVVGGSTPSREVPSFWRGLIPWVTPGEISGETAKLLHDTQEHISASGLTGSGANLLPEGSLMVTTRATLGARSINAVPMTTNQGFKSIVFKTPKDESYYFHLFEKIKPELIRRASGTTFLEISGAEFGSILVPSPSMPEKQLIAEILDTLDTTIQQTAAIVEKLKQVKQGLLHDLLTRGIDANGELRPTYKQAPHLYKESPLGWIPKEWTPTLVGSEANIQHGFAFAGDLFTSEPIGPTLLVPGNFHREGGLYFTDQNTKYFSGKYPAQTVLSNGNVLVVMTDLSPMTLILGRTVVLNESFPVLHNQRIGKFVFKNGGDWDAYFFAALMSDDRVRHKIIAEATGTTVRHTSPDRIKSCYIARPLFDEQKSISTRLLALNERLSSEQKNLAKLRRQKSGLMDDLLTGRVRVTPLLAQSQ